MGSSGGDLAFLEGVYLGDDLVLLGGCGWGVTWPSWCVCVAGGGDLAILVGVYLGGDLVLLGGCD